MIQFGGLDLKMSLDKAAALLALGLLHAVLFATRLMLAEDVITRPRSSGGSIAVRPASLSNSVGGVSMSDLSWTPTRCRTICEPRVHDDGGRVQPHVSGAGPSSWAATRDIATP